jgi:hypothetical protein
VPSTSARRRAASSCSARDPARFAHLGLVPPGARGGDAAWGGAPSELLVERGSPYLAEIANVVAAILSRTGHEIRPNPLPQVELRARIAEGRYALAIDFVRRLGPSPRHALLSLLAAADPALAERPPSGGPVDLDVVARTLRLSVLGELAVSGAHAPDVHGLEQWDLGAVYRDPPPAEPPR